MAYLRNNILSILRNHGDLEISVIVNDNGSTDGTRSWLMNEYLYHKNSKINLNYSLNSNNGYASFGCHQSISFFLSQTECSCFLHLDPDCMIRSFDALPRIVAHAQIGGVGEKRYGLRYRHPKSRSLKKFDEFIFSKWSDRSPKELEDLLIEQHPRMNFLVYKELCGNVMCFPRFVIEKIGNVDCVRYKMWRWDSEYSMRCLLHGYNIEEADVVRDGSIYHFGGRSRNPADVSQMARDLGVNEMEIRSLYQRCAS